MVANEISRRVFLRSVAAASALSSSAVPQQEASKSVSTPRVQLPQIHGPSEQDEIAPGPFLPDDQRVGYAVVGLGRLAINQILPAFRKSQKAKLVALVSGDTQKANTLAMQYGISSKNTYGYDEYDRLADNTAVKAIYIVLPNSMHEEYVIRGARAGKHILCEKPMTTSSASAERMIGACKRANVKLMVAYRQQYEPHNIALRKLVTDGHLGNLRGFVSSNSQQQGDPSQWRLKRSLSGGGCLPDVGLYCLNAARFLSGEEPTSVFATLYEPKDDPRFREVEAGCSFSVRFPSGFIATCTTSYDVHKSQFLRLEGTSAWAELSPAYAYHGNKLTWSHLDSSGVESQITPSIEEKDQFALELDHLSSCILQNKEPSTPGDEGLRDQRIMEAIYESARMGKQVSLPLAS
jgi:predicted dehydrogenase